MKREAEAQVRDDPDLLDEMMRGVAACDPLFRPTNYWSFYEKRFVPELKRKGLHDFRRRRKSVLSSFGATDLGVSGRVVAPWSHRVTVALNSMLGALRPVVKLEADCSPARLTRYFHARVQQKFERLGWSLDSCPTTRIGNPEDLCDIAGQPWSLIHLQYCSFLADAAQHIPLADSLVYCELGTGLGRSLEVLARLRPLATLLAFDIPPQLYVCNQYLSAVLGERVVGFRDALAIAPNGESPAAAIQRKIVLLPSWRLPEWSSRKVDLFWNSASFQEMEPHVVRNYLELVQKMRPEWIYINAMPRGNYWGEWKPGRGGTKERVLEEHYIETLRSTHDLVSTFETEFFLNSNENYRSYIFRRR